MGVSSKTEQWLFNGECRECRRNEYCSKPCTKVKERQYREIREYINEKTGMGKILDALTTQMNERR